MAHTGIDSHTYPLLDPQEPVIPPCPDTAYKDHLLILKPLEWLTGLKRDNPPPTFNLEKIKFDGHGIGYGQKQNRTGKKIRAPSIIFIQTIYLP